jgi:hypothetical protein
MFTRHKLGCPFPLCLGKTFPEPFQLKSLGQQRQPSVQDLLEDEILTRDLPQAEEFRRGGGSAEQEAAVLQDRGVVPSLGAPRHFDRSDEDVARRSPLKAQKR